MKIRDIYKANPSRNTNNYSDYINYIDTSSVIKGRLENVQCLIYGEYPSRAQRLIKKGDILYSSVRPNLRHYYLYTDDLNNAVASTGFVLLRQYNFDYDNKFCYYYLSTDSVVTHLSNIAELSQATFPSCSAKDIENINLPYLKIERQRRIASILSSYDNLIENNNRRIRLLEQMVENLYKEWFVRFRFPGHEDVDYEDGLPKGWKIDNLSNEFFTSSGGTPSRSNPDYFRGKTPWIKTGELLGTFILDTEEHITNEAIANSSAKLIPPYSLLIAMYAGPNVGNLGINVTTATCNQACCVINSKGNYSLLYLMQFLKTQKVFLQSISFGAAQQNISQDIIKRLKVLYPPKYLCEKYNNYIKPYYLIIEKLLKENDNLSRQRDLLLPRLMSGKLEV